MGNITILLSELHEGNAQKHGSRQMHLTPSNTVAQVAEQPVNAAHDGQAQLEKRTHPPVKGTPGISVCA